MQRPSITAPIASATGLAQLEQLMGAAELRLSADHVALLDRASEQPPGTPAAGMEVPPGGQKS
jgi:aryl-alcohol dehydrogenase-like predicted oxidoreductase